MKLSPSESAVLDLANGRIRIDYYDACRVGGNGKTLATLVKKGMLVKHGLPNYTHDWSITDAGRAAIAGVKGDTR